MPKWSVAYPKQIGVTTSFAHRHFNDKCEPELFPKRAWLEDWHFRKPLDHSERLMGAQWLPPERDPDSVPIKRLQLLSIRFSFPDNLG